MCIVSIFSDEKGNFILTQNRDESRLRATSQKVETREIHNQEFTGPVDLVSGGTWIYFSQEYAVCILNGAYKKHPHNPPYKTSRGLVILELLKFNSIDEFIQKTDLTGIEPFTMIMINRFSHEKKILVWDENRKFEEDVSDEKLIIRSSSTLYSDDEKEKHRQFFQDLNSTDSEEIIKLQNRIKMLENNRFPTVMTTSITQIIQKENEIGLQFCPMI